MASDRSLLELLTRRRPGHTTKENRQFLQQGGGAYIIGEKLRSGSAEAKAALSRQGRYKTVAGNLQVKEVRLPDAGDRFIICFNPDQAVRDAAVRVKLIGVLEEMIDGSDKLTLLLIRVAEDLAGQTWPAMRRELQRPVRRAAALETRHAASQHAIPPDQRTYCHSRHTGLRGTQASGSTECANARENR